MKKFIPIFLFFFFVAFTSQSKEIIYSPGEELEYEVSFMGIKLGTVKLIAEDSEIVDGKKSYHAKCFINSNDDIPFVKIKSTFDTWLAENLSHTNKWTGNTYLSGKGWEYQVLKYDQGDAMKLETWKDKKLQSETKFAPGKKLHDGLSIFYFARQYSGSGRKIKVPTVISGNEEFTTFSFFTKNEDIKVDAIDYAVKTNYLKGIADWEGIYGLKGDFEGWFSDDHARVPIKAYLSVMVGKVKIELKSWNRKDWIPPHTDEDKAAK